MPYDLSFNSKIINKREKQANITRDIEIKNNLTVTRGDVGGDNGGKNGKGLKNMYKYPMDKAQRWVGLRVGGRGGWEESGDNCA